MTNQYFGSYQDKPDILDENEEDFSEEEPDISAEIFPAIPPAEAQQKSESKTILADGKTTAESQNAPAEWVSEPTDPPSESKAASTDTGSKIWNWSDPEESTRLRTHWNEIQVEFVDNPREAVQQADAFVSEMVDKTTRMIASEKQSLQNGWKQEKEVSTEDLRQAMQRYHAFFDRLTSNG